MVYVASHMTGKLFPRDVEMCAIMISLEVFFLLRGLQL